MDFSIANISKNEIFLGHDWLKYHNPKIDWKQSTLEFSRCPGACHRGSMVNSPEEEIDIPYNWDEMEEGDHLLVVQIGQEELPLRAYQSKVGQLAEQMYKPQLSQDFNAKLPAYCRPYHKVFEKKTFDQLPLRVTLGPCNWANPRI
ncbi:hypothetical protein AMATHDRAFT_154988 [Amanita thiersii Skay4041]|uniref:Uncharacterized protein n=1 Tax=Amanita thiersii Skay4041 TaxID=703135 RepID=A0A2A9NFM4_9AGAR|nr:hypothetical protein AMATHDRAFT_154988 [Amanita thiersii Skay4041]